MLVSSFSAHDPLANRHTWLCHHSCFNNMLLGVTKAGQQFWPQNKTRGTKWHHITSPKIRRPDLYCQLAKLWEMSSGMLRDAYWLIFAKRGNHQWGSLCSEAKKTATWKVPDERNCHPSTQQCTILHCTSDIRHNHKVLQHPPDSSNLNHSDYHPFQV